MASTILSNINFQSDVFKTTLEAIFTDKLGLLTSGIMQPAPENIIPRDSKGYTVSFAKWNVLSGDSVQITSSTTTAINNVTDTKFTGIWIEREKAWGADQMLSVVAGKDATKEIARMVAEYWAVELHRLAIASLTGAFATALASTHSTGTDYSGEIIKSENVLKAKQLMGDNMDKLVAMVMNSKVYTDAVQSQLTYRENSTSDLLSTGMIEKILGMGITITDKLTATSDIYPCYLSALGTILYKFRPRTQNSITNANVYDINANNFEVQIELNREAKTAGGQDEIITRVSTLVPHVTGTSWDLTSVTSNPTDAQIATGSNWTKAETNNDLIPIIEYKCL